MFSFGSHAGSQPDYHLSENPAKIKSLITFLIALPTDKESNNSGKAGLLQKCLGHVDKALVDAYNIYL